MCYLGYEGTFDENPRTWMEVDDDARLDVKRTRFFDLNHITNVVGTVCPGHELTVRHTWAEDGLTHRSMAKNNKETRDGQQCGRRPLCEMKASRLHVEIVCYFFLYNRLDVFLTKGTFSCTRDHTI